MNNEDMSDIINKINSLKGSNNISPDMVNNLFNMINNSENKNNSSTTQSNNMSNTNNINNSNNSNLNNSQINSNIDFETIMKMKTIIDKMNTKDDPRSNLLQSLKPYLKDSRRSKVDQYIQLMNMSKVMDVFPFMGGGKNNG